MKNSALVTLLTVMGVAVIVAGSLYFGAPAFGWLIVAAIFVIFVGAALRDLKVIKQVERDSKILKSQLENYEKSNFVKPAEGLVAERYRAVMGVSTVENLSADALLEIVNAKFALKLGRSASGVVILLGLMGTFFGLMLSVSTAGSAIDNSSTAATMNTVHSIFSSMKGIFGTSLCGIFASLILSAIHTLLKNDVARFAADLDYYTVSVLYKLCAASTQVGAGNDIGARMEQLVNGMKNSFEKTVVEVKNAFEATQAVTVDSVQKMTNDLATNFANTANALNAKFEAMANANGETTSRLVANVSEQFAGTRTATLESVNGLLDTFKNGLTAAVESSVEKMQSMQNAFPSELKESVAALSDQINGMLAKQAEVASGEWARLMERFAEIADKSAAAEAEHLASLHGESAGLSETLAAEIAKINSNVDASIKGLAEELSASVRTQVEESSAQWNAFMQKLKVASDESEKHQREGLETLANVAVQVAERAQAGSADLTSKVTEEISKLSSDVQTSFKTLAETSAALVDAQTRLLEGVENRVVKENEASEVLTSNINEASTLMRVNQSEFAAGLEMFNKGLESLLEKLSGDTEEKNEEEGFVDQIRRSLELFHERASEILMENAVKTQEILLEILEQSQRAALTSEKKDA